jgi:hypothetical protein
MAINLSESAWLYRGRGASRIPGRAERRSLLRTPGALSLGSFHPVAVGNGICSEHLQRRRGKTHNQALRALANRLVAILHGCLRHRRAYEEAVAWYSAIEMAA